MDKINENIIYEPYTSLEEQRAAEKKIEEEIKKIIESEKFEQYDLQREVDEAVEKYKQEVNETYEIFNLNRPKEEIIDPDDIDEEYDDLEGETE